MPWIRPEESENEMFPYWVWNGQSGVLHQVLQTDTGGGDWLVVPASTDGRNEPVARSPYLYMPVKAGDIVRSIANYGHPDRDTFLGGVFEVDDPPHGLVVGLRASRRPFQS